MAERIPDLELPSIPLDKLMAGYPKLAGRMGLFPELAILRRFGSLNMRNLLYMQAELVYLENELQERELADRHADYRKNWFWLRESDQSGEGDQPRQLCLVLAIREKLKEYNDALIQQASIASLSKPAAYDLHEIQQYLISDEMEKGTSLIGPDSYIWGSVREPEQHCLDLVALQGRQQEDSFSKLVVEKGMNLFFRLNGHRLWKPSPVYGYNDRQILRITYWITTVLASLLLIAPIVVLYRVTSMKARLGIIVLFNFLLSACLVAFTTARRSELFTITATFSAVQVVFISANSFAVKTG